MKVAFMLFAWRKRLLILVATSSLLAASSHPVLATSGDSSDEALVAARAWISQIDAGDYLDSYAAGCDEFHQKVAENKWVLVLRAFRPSFGTVVTRREVGHVFKDDGVNGLDGQCVVITYDTCFSRLHDGCEQVILKLEDGKWRGAYYEAGPKPTAQPDEDGPAPQVNTEVQSVMTQHPQQ